MKGSNKYSPHVEINSILQQLQTELFNKGFALQNLLEVAYPDADAICSAVKEIKFHLEDHPVDIYHQRCWRNQVSFRGPSCGYLPPMGYRPCRGRRQEKIPLNPSCSRGEYIIDLLLRLYVICICIIIFFLLRWRCRQFQLEDQPVDICHQWVTAHVVVDDKKKSFSNLRVREVIILLIFCLDCT